MIKVIKNDHFSVFLVVWGLIPKLLGRLRVTYSKIASSDKSATCSCVPEDFNLRCYRVQQGGLLKPRKNVIFRNF